MNNHIYRSGHACRPITLIFAAIALSVLIGGCSGNPYSKPKAVVHEMYSALSEGDMERYMETLHPSNRQRPNPLGLLSALSLQAGIGGVGLGADLSDLLHMTYEELDVRVVKSDPDYALVEARGQLRMPILLMEVPFCEQHDLRRQGGRWYVDVYAPEKRQRLETLLEQHMKDAHQGRPVPDIDTLEEGLSFLAEGLFTSMESSFDKCTSSTTSGRAMPSSEEVLARTRCVGSCHEETNEL